jgi:hypothetical protein
MSCQLQGILIQSWLVIAWWFAMGQSRSVAWCRHSSGETKENHKNASITSNLAEIWTSYILIYLLHFLLLLHKCQLLHLNIAVLAGLSLKVVTIVGSSHCLLTEKFSITIVQIKFSSNSLLGFTLEGTRNIQYCVFRGVLITVPVPEGICGVFSDICLLQMGWLQGEVNEFLTFSNVAHHCVCL